MQTLISKTNLAEVLETLASEETLIFDCETSGLSAYHASQMFSLAVATLDGRQYYANFKPYDTLQDDYVLEYGDLLPLFRTERIWVAHNAKFDLHFTFQYGFNLEGTVVDTKAWARVYENIHHPWVPGGGYSLDACAKRWLDQKKDDAVKIWMDENFAFTSRPGSAKRDYHFDLVPFEIISNYAMIDAEVTAKLYLFLKDKLQGSAVAEIEMDLCPVLFHMENRGVKIDREYCLKAEAFEQARMADAASRIAKEIPHIFNWSDSVKCLGAEFEARGFELTFTDKGNLQLTDEVLSQKPDLLAEALIIYRDASKRLNTYWRNYLTLADQAGFIHASFDSSGTVTGRFSCYNPNLQNIPADDDSEYPVRRAFMPSKPGRKLVSIDYKAVELRLALEYANEIELIDKIKAGHDPHQAAADLTGLTRKQAKVFNFSLIYGSGTKALAKLLKCEESEAKDAKDKYFEALPNLKSFMDRAKNRFIANGEVKNCFGRRYMLEDRRYAYKAANLIIQGSSADIIKKAMIAVDAYLLDKQSKLILTIHDELVFDMAEEELELIPDLQKIMANAYPHKLMPLDTSAESGPNLFDQEPV